MKDTFLPNLKLYLANAIICITKTSFTVLACKVSRPCIKGLSIDYRLTIKYVRKISRKTNISNPLIRTSTCAYQGVRNVSFSENFAYVLNGWLFMTFSYIFQETLLNYAKVNVLALLCFLEFIDS